AFFAVAAAAQAEAFRFVQISDTHHGRPLHQYRYRKAIEEINALPFPVECVVHTGDIVSNGFKSPEVAGAASNMLALVEAPTICCPGNHDLVFKYSDPTNRFLRCAAVYKRFFGPLAQVHETSNAVFVAICTESLRLDAAPQIPGFDPLAWLDETLSARAGKPAFVCTHVPDCDDYFRGVFEPGWENSENLAAWRAVLAHHPDVKAVLAGHFHRNAYAEHGDGGPPTVVASCFAGFWGRQASYRVFTYEDGRLSWQDAYIEDPPPDVFITGDGRAIPESADSAPAPAPEPPATATP
ncbi:MAG: metallophosphoesterase, partial [Kiritimatiellae bacterium]|nr:metallophosphoesterase [Kiritimatiellia bacterium]